MDSLIETKLQSQFVDPNVLPRLHLVDRLENGRFRKLTLISAPAGYGKSILASLWQKACDCPAAWISLDKKDNDLGLFLRYLIYAVQTICPDVYKKTESQLYGLELPPLDLLKASLLQETAVLPQPILIMLDDYHLIQNPEIHQLLDALLQYQPFHLHVVLITRQDPPLDLITLRAKNDITEIRLADLRFSQEESAQYLATHLHSELSPETIQELIQQTEGWAVGLRLTALALRNQVNPSYLAKADQRSNHYIMSYLVNEVLQRQPQHIQTFLLYTSLLDRFSPALSEALLKTTGADEQINSQDILEQLCQENLFLFPLDTKREWFRYHHLFQELLQHQLKTAVSATTINHLHTRASSWFVQNGFIEEALDHAFAANDIEQAVQIVDQVRYRLMNETQWQRLQKFLQRFPRAVIDRSPDLLMTEIWLYYHYGQTTKLPAALAQINQLVEGTAVSPVKKQHLLGEINAVYSFLSYFSLDVEATRTHAQEALAQAAPELWLLRVFARLMLAAAQQMSGDLNSAYTTMLRNFDAESGQSNLLKASTLTVSCSIAWFVADLTTIQQYAAQAINLFQDAPSPALCGNAHYHAGTVAYLQNDLATAAEHFTFVQKRPYNTYSSMFAYSSCGLALIHQAQGHEQEARAVVEAALAFFLETGNTPLLLLMKAFQAELDLRQGQFSTALQWATQFDAIPPLTPMHRLYDLHFTLVKIWLAENTRNGRKKAADLLAQIKTFLETTHNKIFLIDTLLLQATLHQADGKGANALTTLEQALA